MFESMYADQDQVRFICEINWLNIANELLCYCGYLFDIYIQKLNVIALLLDIIIYFSFFGYCCSHNRIDVIRCDAMKGNFVLVQNDYY